MSRSFRRTPIWGMCNPKASEADDKKLWHGALRAAERRFLAAVRSGLGPIEPHFRDVSDPWIMHKDGKAWRVGGGRYDWRTDPWVTKMMRK